MKAVISLPDPLFREAEAVRKSLKISRSRLYADAIESYVKKRRHPEITENLDRVYSRDAGKLDPVFAALQLEVLAREKW